MLSLHVVVVVGGVSDVFVAAADDILMLFLRFYCVCGHIRKTIENRCETYSFRKEYKTLAHGKRKQQTKRKETHE